MSTNAIQHPKVVVLGSGSLFFGRQSIWQMVHSPHLNKGTLALVDTDPERMEKMATLARMVVAETGVDLTIEASCDRRDVLAGSDFVVLSFADRSVKFRGIDCKVSEKYGIRMCSGDTIGPGGIFRTMRELPVILDCANDVRELCPDAWLINYINPSAANGIGLSKYASDLKSFALCDGLHMPHVKRHYAERAGLVKAGEPLTDEIDKAFDFRISGVNHFTWLLKAEYNGEDVVPTIAEQLKQAAATETDGLDKGAKAMYNAEVTHELYKIFGYIPTCTAHTKEYLPYWQGHNTTAEKVPPLSIWETEARYKRHDDMWEQVDNFINGTHPISTYMDTFGPDHATDIIETMVAGLNKPFFINTVNNGALPNMGDNAFLEMLCDVDINGPKPRTIGNMPAGLHGLQQQVLDTHELTVDAAVNCDRDLLRRAMLTDPIVNAIADADKIIEKLLKAERDALPAKWFE